MDARNLRVGNILLFQESKGELFGINKDCIVQYSQDNDIYYCGIDEIKPIELTEDILLKCGFEKEKLKPSNKHSEYFSIWIEDYKYSFSFSYFRNNWGFYHSYTDALEEEDNNRFDAISFGIKHLHQLQNLYWCLTNEELNVQL